MTAPRRLQTLADVPATGIREMSCDESKDFVTCSLLEDHLKKEGRGAIDAASLLSMIQADFPAPAGIILAGRLAAVRPSGLFSPAVCIFLAQLSPSPVRAVLWAHYLVVRTRPDATVDMWRLALDFPDGFPTDEACSRIWDAQKKAPDDPPDTPSNCLDAVWAWAPGVAA